MLQCEDSAWLVMPSPESAGSPVSGTGKGQGAQPWVLGLGHTDPRLSGVGVHPELRLRSTQIHGSIVQSAGTNLEFQTQS